MGDAIEQAGNWLRSIPKDDSDLIAAVLMSVLHGCGSVSEATAIPTDELEAIGELVAAELLSIRLLSMVCRGIMNCGIKDGELSYWLVDKDKAEACGNG